MSEVILDELDLKPTGVNTVSFDTRINKLISSMVNTEDSKTKRDLQTQINILKKEKSYYKVKQYFKKFMANIFILGLFTINLIAVAVSMSCSRNQGIFKRLTSALYAFFFSLLYIPINYRYYRLTVKKDTTSCNICPNNPFAL
tara:strand:- start:3298 stop:3726 length:429 start_codon:yes stop_codon:yes gene_type:complete